MEDNITSGKQALNSYSYGHNYTGQSMGGGHTYTGQSIGGGHSHNGHSPGGSYMFNGQSQTYLYNGQPASCYSNNGHNSHNGQPHYQWTGHTSGHSIGWGASHRGIASPSHEEHKKVKTK